MPWKRCALQLQAPIIIVMVFSFLFFSVPTLRYSMKLRLQMQNAPQTLLKSLPLGQNYYRARKHWKLYVNWTVVSLPFQVFLYYHLGWTWMHPPHKDSSGANENHEYYEAWNPRKIFVNKKKANLMGKILEKKKGRTNYYDAN